MNTIEVDCNDIEENVVQDSNPKKSTIVLCGEKKKVSFDKILLMLKVPTTT